MPRAAALVAWLLLASACRSVVPAAPLPPDDPRPDAFLARWADLAEQRRALRGIARVAVDADAVQFRGKQVLVVERPARLRVEILGFLGQTLAVLVTDGDRFELFRAGDGGFESGAVHPGLLWEVAHLALTPEQAVDLLLGVPMPGAALRVIGAERAAGGGIRIDLADAGGAVRRRVVFDAEARLRDVEAREADGREIWRARFDDYELVGGAPFAHKISIDVRAGNTRAEISFRDVEINPELPDGVFVLRQPGPG
ncbi:MAG: outer membrane lipoprotein-sorting protein [Myxococcales bacterium]|nr:outer membrane lipoprotein-sorting protein [Myxococcales bacterium]